MMRRIGAAALLALGAMVSCRAASSAPPTADRTVVVFRKVPVDLKARDQGLAAMDPDGGNRHRPTVSEIRAYKGALQEHGERASSFHATAITWSVDGRRVAFLRRPGDFFVADADGGNERKLDYDARSPFFLPNGTVIIAQGMPGDSILEMDAGGGNLKLFCKPRLPGGLWTIEALSPAGDQILYRKYGQEGLYRLDLKTLEEIDLGTGLDPIWMRVPDPEIKKGD